MLSDGEPLFWLLKMILTFFLLAAKMAKWAIDPCNAREGFRCQQLQDCNKSTSWRCSCEIHRWGWQPHRNDLKTPLCNHRTLLKVWKLRIWYLTLFIRFLKQWANIHFRSEEYYENFPEYLCLVGSFEHHGMHNDLFRKNSEFLNHCTLRRMHCFSLSSSSQLNRQQMDCKCKCWRRS